MAPSPIDSHFERGLYSARDGVDHLVSSVAREEQESFGNTLIPLETQRTKDIAVDVMEGRVTPGTRRNSCEKEIGVPLFHRRAERSKANCASQVYPTVRCALFPGGDLLNRH